MGTVGDDDCQIAMAPVVGTLLTVAAKHGRGDIAALLLQANADANTAEVVQWQSGASPEKRTPLELAVWSGNVEAVSVLLESGAEVAAVFRKPDSSSGQATPMEEATARGLTDIAQLLLRAMEKAGAPLGPDAQPAASASHPGPEQGDGRIVLGLRCRR